MDEPGSINARTRTINTIATSKPQLFEFFVSAGPSEPIVASQKNYNNMVSEWVATYVPSPYLFINSNNIFYTQRSMTGGH